MQSALSRLCLLSLIPVALTGCASVDPEAGPESPATVEATRVAETVAAHVSLFDWMSLPVRQGRSYYQYSTRDRGERTFPGLDADNKDFNNFVAACGDRPQLFLQTDLQAPCEPGLDGYMIASDNAGPGFVSRIWFAWGGRGFVRERIRIFVDDLDAPVYDAPLSSWRQGASDPFVAPLTHWTSGAIVSYVPIAYQHKLRILIDGLKRNALYYNQTNVQRGQDLGSGFVLQSPRELSDLQARVHAAEGSAQVVDRTFVLEPGQSSDLFERAGSGVITQLRFTTSAQTPDDLRGLILRMHWERSEQPAVELPLSAFFGAELSLAEYHTLPLSAAVSDQAVTLEANWPLPYFEHVRISITNTGDAARELSVRAYERRQAPPLEAGHFHVHYQQNAGPFERGDRYQVAKLSGPGKYVGTLMFLQGKLDPETVAPGHALAFLEGDERITVDGVETVSGTGTEDYFDAGYYWNDGRFDSPFATLISHNEEEETGSVTAARWHILTNSIEHKQSLDFSFEYGANRPNTASHYASVAYYYLFD